MNADEYRKPTMLYISRRQAPDLYDVEAQLEDAIDAVAAELAAVLGFTASQKYTHTIPELLASILESYDQNASILAATAYLENKGYEVIRRGMAV
jgi:hypothetical protein